MKEKNELGGYLLGTSLAFYFLSSFIVFLSAFVKCENGTSKMKNSYRLPINWVRYWKTLSKGCGSLAPINKVNLNYMLTTTASYKDEKKKTSKNHMNNI